VNDTSSLSLFVIFLDGFNVGEIYRLGWHAASQWMVFVTGIITALAIAIRSLEEHINLLSGGQSGYQKMVVNILVITVAIGMYFTLAAFVIDFFNAIYSVLDKGELVKLTEGLDKTLDKLWKKEHDFKFSEIGDSIISAFAYVGYKLTQMVLVTVTLSMRILHALLVCMCLFWGAVALPMSITTGLKMLTPLRNISILVLIWPILENLFMYLIGGVFTDMLNSSLNVDNMDTWDMGLLVVFLTAYSVINILLIATLIATPYVAQGLANGSGNVSGMIGSFAGAGIAAGMLAAKALGGPAKAAGAAGGGALKSAAQNGPTVGGAIASAAKGISNMGKKALGISPSGSDETKSNPSPKGAGGLKGNNQSKGGGDSKGNSQSKGSPSSNSPGGGEKPTSSEGGETKSNQSPPGNAESNTHVNDQPNKGESSSNNATDNNSNKPESQSEQSTQDGTDPNKGTQSNIKSDSSSSTSNTEVKNDETTTQGGNTDSDKEALNNKEGSNDAIDEPKSTENTPPTQEGKSSTDNEKLEAPPSSETSSDGKPKESKGKNKLGTAAISSAFTNNISNPSDIEEEGRGAIVDENQISDTDKKKKRQSQRTAYFSNKNKQNNKGKKQ